jgi:S-adenosylmethionine uptake transporter
MTDDSVKGPPAGVPVSLACAFWMLVSAVGFAMLMGLVRHLAAEMDVFVISFWRSLFAALAFAPWAWRVGWQRLRTKRLGLYVTRSAFLVLSSTALFFSVTMLPLAEVTAISFTSPLFATLLAVLLLKDPVGPRRWAAMAVGFAGVLIMLRPGAASFDWGTLLVIFATVTFAAVIVTGKMLTKTESPELIVAYLALFMLPMALVPALTVWQWPTWQQIPWLIAIAVGANLNMYGITRALKIADASLAMPFDFLRLPATAAVGFLAFAEEPDIFTWAGGAVIFASSAYIGHREARLRRAGAGDVN